MGRIGHGYGSEWHLLHWLGRHRAELSRRVGAAIGGAVNPGDWLDFPTTSSGGAPKTMEWKGIDFLRPNPPVERAWAAFWPQRGNAHNWDAVARVGDEPEWLLVEAKAHVGELASSCGASPRGGLPAIQAALDSCKRHLGVGAAHDWTTGYYQHANRVAALHFLQQQGIPARLLFVYFLGERRRGWQCPKTEADWRPALVTQDGHLGLNRPHPLSSRIHDLFLPVVP